MQFFLHYHSIVSRPFDDSYYDFEGVYYDNIESFLWLYKKYQEIFCCVIFDTVSRNFFSRDFICS